MKTTSTTKARTAAKKQSPKKAIPKKRGRPAKRSRTSTVSLQPKARTAKKAAGTRQCGAKTRTGEACKRVAVGRTKYCSVHVPKVEKRPRDEMHKSRCNVCKSPYLSLIERRFSHWEPAGDIAADFPGMSESAIKRHARWAGLMAKRFENYQHGLDMLIGKAMEAGVSLRTGADMVAAMTLKAKIKGDIVQKHDISGDIIFKSDGELADRLNNIIAVGKARSRPTG